MLENNSSSNNGERELFCRKFKNNDRILLEYRGFRLASLKLILEYSFPGFVLKIHKNHTKLQFDIYLTKNSLETGKEIDLEELQRFSSFYGPGFNLIVG